MKIHNVRIGHATNSSSSHSIIFLQGYKPKEVVEPDGYGWNEFVLTSKTWKLDYLASQIRTNLKGFGEDFITIINKGLGLPHGSYVDHQSAINFPKEFGVDTLSIDFIQDFKWFLERGNVAVVGGNDNEDCSETINDLLAKSKRFPLAITDMSGDLVCRKDGDWWTIYNRDNGSRVILSFEDNPAPFKPHTPLLVDFSITNWCDMACNFCYKGSTKKGKDIDSGFMYHIINDLQKAQVFEVAIGGGEPTTSESFLSFITSLKIHGIVANFTTKKINWLMDATRASYILNKVGAFAYSFDMDDGWNNIEEIYGIMKERDYDLKKFHIQAIPGILPPEEQEKLIRWCVDRGIVLTLLGFKTTGRGEAFLSKNEKEILENEASFIDTIKKVYSGSWGSVGIDTTLAARYQQRMKNEEVPKWMYHIKEGQYSAYIDGVARKFGPSSYHPEALIPYDGDYYGSVIADLFAKIESV